MIMYHLPALLRETIDHLNIQAEGTYVDVTFGGGGHSKVILQHLNEHGKLFGFDQDTDAIKNTLDDERFTFVHSNFQHLQRFLKLHNTKQVDGILADLGVSSHQLDQAERGFSYRFDAELDMRMNQKADLTASEVLNKYSAEALQHMFSRYGEVRNSKTLAYKIVEDRQARPFKYISDLLGSMDTLIRGNRLRYLSQVFQAIRIEVNQEMQVLENFLEQALQVLKPGGRLVVISYHSLEDRIIKNFFKTGNIDGEVKKDFYGNIERPFKIITKKAVLPTKEECRENPRARSAKLRVAEKNG